MLRARVGDTIELTLANAKDSKAIHSIDLHAVTGGHGGGEHTQVAPGQEKPSPSRPYTQACLCTTAPPRWCHSTLRLACTE
nr:hypothetical protein [Comamonas jiangduensis]